ncbi:MAG: ATP synthase F1 subunit epsilon [Clostridiales bacterium]|jgi:F-type H+-transporting ATPase subunit epsilon|nr:ATP synthase F1 subunit epsilon [Clostridiales bacterium]
MNNFNLNIMTPERMFFSGKAKGLIITAPDGELCILAGHIPLVAPIVIGVLKINLNGEWKSAFCSEGFIEVLHNSVTVFVQACEWPEEIDIVRARRSLERAREHLRQKQSVKEYKESKIALSRAMARLRITRQNINSD